MLELTLIVVTVLLLGLVRRHWILQRGIRSLVVDLKQRRPFLSETEPAARLQRSWRELVGETARLVEEVNRLNQLKSGHLAQLEAAMHSLQEGVMIVDRGNRIVLANQAFSAMYADLSSLLGQRVEVVIRNPAFLDFLEEVRHGRAPPRREFELHPSAGPLWVEATGAAVPGTAEENGPWTLFVLHDITRPKHLETVRREFVANVSHELKTPLSVIKGYAETLDDDHRTMAAEEREQFIRGIRRHAERLAAILEDLLVLSRLESGRPGLRLAPVLLGPFLQSVHDEYAAPLAASGHPLSLAVGEVAAVTVTADASRLLQVFGNLLDNAQKYSPPGSPVEIGARRPPGSAEVEIWVRDAGPGIPAADLPRIFERFYRVEKGRARETGGTGLGLSIVKHIVQLHGGTVGADSAPGRGTRIFFCLPLAAGARPEDAPPVIATKPA